jgi:hypothetical protein
MLSPQFHLPSPKTTKMTQKMAKARKIFCAIRENGWINKTFFMNSIAPIS